MSAVLPERPPSACAQCRSAISPGARVCPVCRALQPATIGARAFESGVTVDRKYGRIVAGPRIGEGGMGIVLEGWLFYPPTDPRASAPVRLALKVLRPDSPLKVELRHFLEREANLLLRLDHPNVVQRFDAFDWPEGDASADRSLVLAMEFVDGSTLADVIARTVARAALAGPYALPGMPFLRAWAYFQQLLGALAATHSLGIVHLDVKPSNVLVRRDRLVKLTDFGIAHSTLAPASMEVSALAPGSGLYMSPEQVLGQKVDARSDLYSAGVVFYEMLSGRTPFLDGGRGELAVRHDQVAAMPPPIRRFLPQAPLVVEALFQRALSKTKEDRFESAIAMGDAFREALSLPDSPEWRAQAEVAKIAKSGDRTDKIRMGTLRDFLVEKYKTVPIAQR